MIKTFISKTGGGKSLCLMLEAAKQSGKDVAFISLEMSAETIKKRIGLIGTDAKSFNIITPTESNYKNLGLWLNKKIETLCQEVDVICVDAIDLIPGFNVEKLDNICFGSMMNQCEELWASMNVCREIKGFSKSVIEKTDGQSEFIKVKQICSRVEHPLMPGVFLIESVDLEKKEIKYHNASNLLKSK